MYSPSQGSGPSLLYMSLPSHFFNSEYVDDHTPCKFRRCTCLWFLHCTVSRRVRIHPTEQWRYHRYPYSRVHRVRLNRQIVAFENVCRCFLPSTLYRCWINWEWKKCVLRKATNSGRSTATRCNSFLYKACHYRPSTGRSWSLAHPRDMVLRCKFYSDVFLRHKTSHHMPVPDDRIFFQ